MAIIRHSLDFICYCRGDVAIIRHRLDFIGGCRGEVAMRLLLEMNHEVRGDYVQETVEQVGYTNSCFIVNCINISIKH